MKRVRIAPQSLRRFVIPIPENFPPDANLAQRAAPRAKADRRPPPFARWNVAGGALLAVLLFTPPLRSQQITNVSLDANEQLFAILAALNVAGYDTGFGPGNAARAEARTLLSGKHAASLDAIRKFYEEHRIANDASADLGQYVSLALLMGSPPGFKLTVPESDLPPDAKAVAGLAPLLKAYYQEVNLQSVWTRLQPAFEKEIAWYSDAVRKALVSTDAYFRLPGGLYMGRNYSISIDLLGAPEQVQARIYGSNYYLVVTPAAEPKINEIRHLYLHFLLDPLAMKYAVEIHQKAELRHIAYQAPALAADFKEDFSLLLTECLIRAAELRMDKRSRVSPDKAVDDATRSGLILVPYFYAALAAFEKQDSAMNVYYRDMILGIDPRTEEKRLAAVQFSPAENLASTVAAPNISEEEKMLREGENDIYQGKYLEAKAVFQGALEKFNPNNPRALYGLAVAESNTRKPDLAEKYFKKTLEVARDLRIATWSHIYLGRLYDLEGERTKALDEYRAASLTAGTYPEAVRAVEDGMNRPFGFHK